MTRKSKYKFPNAASEFVYVRTYSRWNEDLGRRETWEETVQRYIDYIENYVGDKVPQKVFKKAKEKIINMEVMPSMRALWSAGKAADADHTTFYNCSFQVIDSIESFAEGLYALMCGAGYGYSVSKKHIDKLPEIPHLTPESDGTYIVPDTKFGWAESTKKLMKALYNGRDLDVDYSDLRPKGAYLKTMGGRSSGPEPLIRLHHFIRDIFQNAQGRKLTPVECSDICNQIAEVVVMGGVRRSSQISLSDLDDEEMANAKVGDFPVRRYMSNNSAIYLEKPTAARFLKEWSILANSNTGERGIFNLEAARVRSPNRRNKELISGTNPCGEINLRSQEFCNLTEVIVRVGDDLDDLLSKVETAVWLGVIQSTFTYFPYLRKQWKKNCEEERLLGVSITGQFDNIEIINEQTLKAMKSKAIKTAKHASRILGINMPAAITCVKPSGTVSQLVNSSSGLHPRYSKYYIRRYRIASTDPLYKLLKSQGIKMIPENGERKKDWEKAKRGNAGACKIYEKGKQWTEDKVTTWVVSFPVKSPKKCVTREKVSAIDQLNHYKMLMEYWCEHNASCTVYVRNEEWFEVGNWVYKNWKYVNGISFLPFDGGQYKQAPFEAVNRTKYEKILKDTKKIDYSKLVQFEQEDNTDGAKEIACTGDKCDI